jgi:hypothetical protein
MTVYTAQRVKPIGQEVEAPHEMRVIKPILIRIAPTQPNNTYGVQAMVIDVVSVVKSSCFKASPCSFIHRIAICVQASSVANRDFVNHFDQTYVCAEPGTRLFLSE